MQVPGRTRAARSGATLPRLSEQLLDESGTRPPAAQQRSHPFTEVVDRAMHEAHGSPPHHSNVTNEKTPSAIRFVPPWALL
jgi:hypothetical protein